MSALRAPSPKTVCVPTCQRWQPRHDAAASRNAVRFIRSGRKSAADPVSAARATPPLFPRPGDTRQQERGDAVFRLQKGASDPAAIDHLSFAMSDPAYPLRLVDERAAAVPGQLEERSLVDSYRRL